jgi:HSP20 family molecular chaperone IbpA
MAIESASDSTLAARALAQKRKELEDLQNSLEVEKAQIERQRTREIAAEKDKSDRELVQVSKAASNQAEQVRKFNSERVRMLNENQQKDYERLAKNTADQVARMDKDAMKTIEDHRAGTMERLRFVTDQTEDPFYRLKSLNPVLSETEKEFRVKLSLPEHEAKNIFVSGEGQTLKVSLARKFQDRAKTEEGDRSTKTATHQSIVETIAMPGAFDAKGIKRDYTDGVLTIFVPRAGVAPIKV